MKKCLVFLGALALMMGLVFAPIIPVAGPSCKPTSATNGMIGCWPQVNPSTVTSSDYFDIWQPGPFPASANLVSIYGLFAAPPPIGTSTTPAIGWLQAIGVSDLLTHTATVTLEFPTFAAFTAYKPSVITTALAWAGAPVVAHTAGYYAAGDGGSATYAWNSSSSATVDSLYVITPGGGASGRWLLQEAPGGASVKQLGVHVDGVTPDDVLLKSALAACTVRGTRLNMPAGVLLMTGAGTATSFLESCALAGVNVPAAGLTSASLGSMIKLTSTSVQPFVCRLNWSITGINFLWPNQTTGTTAYPPLITDDGANQCGHATVDNVVIVNAYDGFTQQSATSWVDIKFSNSTMYAVHKMFTLSRTGDSFAFSNTVRFSPTPWFDLCNYGACVAAVQTAAQSNAIFDIAFATGPGVTLSINGSETFAWRTTFLLEANASFEGSTINMNMDGTGTVIDASASGAAWSINNSLTGFIVACGVFNAPTIQATCFNMGNSSTLVLNDFQTGGAVGDFYNSSGSSLYMNGGVIGAVGIGIAGTDHYFVNQTANNNSVVSIKNVSLGYNNTLATHTKIHAIQSVAVNRLIVQDNNFDLFNDVLNVAYSPITVITGNSSTGSLATSVAFTGSGSAVYKNNKWDTPPLTAVSACGAGATMNGTFAGSIQTGTTPVLACTITVPVQLPGMECFFAPSAATLFSTTAATANSFRVNTPGDIAGAQITYHCAGDL